MVFHIYQVKTEVISIYDRQSCEYVFRYPSLLQFTCINIEILVSFIFFQ